MCLNPDVQEKLRLEIVSVLDGGKIELDQENFKKLRYLRKIHEYFSCFVSSVFLSKICEAGN